MVCLLVSMYQYTHLYITSNDHSGISPLLVNKHRLSLKSDPTLQVPNSLSDPDRIPLTYVSVTFTDYRSAFSPTGTFPLRLSFSRIFRMRVAEPYRSVSTCASCRPWPHQCTCCSSTVFSPCSCNSMTTSLISHMFSFSRAYAILYVILNLQSSVLSVIQIQIYIDSPQIFSSLRL